MLQRRQQEGAEPATFLLRMTKRFVLNERGKESLCQVLCILRTVALTAHVSIKRIPISAAKFLQRLLRPGRGIVNGREHNTPMSGRKPLCAEDRPAPFMAHR